jgi:hypothetical protein
VATVLVVGGHVVMFDGFTQAGPVLTGIAAVITATAQLITVLRRDKRDQGSR